jgi:RNase P/RNase MRP subunit p30
MFDSFVAYNISSEEKKRFNLTVGSAKVSENLNINKNEVVFLSPKSDELLTKAVRMSLPYGVINAELLYPKDSVQHVKSGIDDTLAKELASKKIAVVFNLNLLLTSSDVRRGSIIRRMLENMKRAVKYDIPVLFASSAKNKFELFNGQMIKAWANYLGIDNFSRVKTSFTKIFS